MSESLFGTDGFRGSAEDTHQPGKINFDTFYGLARQYASLIHEQKIYPGTYVVGSDNRSSSPELRQAVCQGLATIGTEVLDLGVAPTPVVAWIAKNLGHNAAVITASHNHSSDNGLKLFVGGDKAPKLILNEVEKRYFNSIGNRNPEGFKGGRVISGHNLINEYLRSVVSSLGGSDALFGHTVIIDGANGAAHEIAPKLYKALGAQVVEFACQNDGSKINLDCGAAHLEGVQEFLNQRDDLTYQENFLGAFSSDGDADRVMGVDKLGRPVDGNYWLKRLAVGQVGIVGTVYTNSALRLAVKDMGVEFYECQNGDVNVTAMLQKLNDQNETGFKRGGEFTGHLIDLDHLTSGDGLYMGAWLATRLAEQNISLADIKDEMQLWPQKMVNHSLNGKNANELISQPEFAEALTKQQDMLGDCGRIIVRASGTEPVVRIWAEAQELEALHEVISRLSKALMV